ncbi:HlyD family secretion protein [Bradyrhizobium liaoningense]
MASLDDNSSTDPVDRSEAAPKEGKLRRLTRSPSVAEEAPENVEAVRPALKVPYPEEKERPDTPRPEGVRTSGRKTSRRRVLMFALLPVALIVGGYWYVTGGATMSTDNAYVQADMVGLSTDVSGIVREVLVHDNQTVARGDVLFKLDPLQFQLALQRAEAQVNNTGNDLVALQASYKNMQAQVEQAKTDVEFNSVNFNRQQQLIANHFTPQASFDTARNTLQASEQKLASLEHQLSGIAANLNGHPDAPIEEHPRYKDVLAARNEAARQLEHTVVRAPFAGIVTNVPSLQPGQYLAAAATAFNIVSSEHVWVQASPKETELTYVKPGQKATVEVDTYPGAQWTGAVDSISPASASSFSLLPAENTSGNWVKVVQRIPMRVRIDNVPGRPPLRVGMSVELNVDTGHARGLPTFLTAAFGLSQD